MYLSFHSNPVWIIIWPVKLSPATEEIHKVSIFLHTSLTRGMTVYCDI